MVADVLAVSRSEEREFTRGMAQTIKDTEFHQLRLHTLCDYCITTILSRAYLSVDIRALKTLQKSAQLVEQELTIMVHEFKMIILCIVYFLECSCFLF